MRDLNALNAERRGRFTIGYLFFMGARHGGNESHDADDELIEREATAFGDVLRLDVGDSYLNHTRKVVAVYEWVLLHCGDARYLLKSDDDVFVNVERLESDVRELERGAALEAAARDSLAYTQFGCAAQVWCAMRQHLRHNTMLRCVHSYVESRTSIQRGEDSKQFLSFEVCVMAALTVQCAALTALACRCSRGATSSSTTCTGSRR